MNEKGFVSEKRFVSKKNLSRAWRRLFGKVLNSKEEIEANTSENMIAGAEAVKEVYSSFAYDENGIYGYRRKVDGADTVIPFKNAIKLKQFCQKSQMVIDEDYDECLLVFSSAGSYGSFSIINGNYTKQQAGKSMLTNVSGINGQANTECYIIKNLPKGAVISASKNNTASTIWNYSFWLFR